MCPRRSAATLVVLAVLVTPAAAAPATRRPAAAPVDADLERPASWSIPTSSHVRDEVLAWVGRQSAARDRLEAVGESWPARESPEGEGDLLDRVVTSFAALDERCAVLWRTARESVDARALPAAADWLTDAGTDVFERDAVRLWLGRELVRHGRFDEGLALLADLDPATAVDPAALFFHRAACQHWLLESDLAIETLDRLLERSGEIPVRYERVARLLRADIASLEDESLDHIARRMRDVSRRLGLGRAGTKTVAIQDGVIESLDKLIKALEQQQQQQQQSQGASGAGGGGRGGDGTPMDDSRIAGGKGPGEVTKKDLGDTDGWGKLPPHQREEALQQIGREFPAHYREAIEQYFKRLASGEEKR